MTSELDKHKSTFFELINKGVTAICGFLLVIVFNNIRNEINEIKTDLKLSISNYNDINTRLKIIEYKIENKNTSYDYPSFDMDKLYFLKPEEYEFNRKDSKKTKS